jgi:hypothetical protein
MTATQIYRLQFSGHADFARANGGTYDQRLGMWVIENANFERHCAINTALANLRSRRSQEWLTRGLADGDLIS